MNIEIGRLIIYGAGALGHEIAEYACDAYDWDLWDTTKIKFIDDTPGLRSNNNSWSVINGFQNYKSQIGDKFLIGIGDPIQRNIIYDFLIKNNCDFATLIHPDAYVSKFSKISPGSIVAPFCTVGTESFLSCNVVLNTYAAIGHHVSIGKSCVVSPKVLVSGRSRVGDLVFIGSNAVITPQVSIGCRCKVAASSVVYRNCEDDFLITGNPSKKFKL